MEGRVTPFLNAMHSTVAVRGGGMEGDQPPVAPMDASVRRLIKISMFSLIGQNNSLPLVQGDSQNTNRSTY